MNYSNKYFFDGIDMWVAYGFAAYPQTNNEFFPALWVRLFSKSKKTKRFGIMGQTLSYALAKLNQDDDFSIFAKVATFARNVLYPTSELPIHAKAMDGLRNPYAQPNGSR